MLRSTDGFAGRNCWARNCRARMSALLPAFAVLCAWGPVCLPLGGSTLRAAEPPNVILIMTDNHGAWTLGCYGNEDIRTPNIDRLAREGTLFDRAFSSNPVCSPTRATFLTGLLPSQHGVHCFLFGGRLQVGPEARCTLDRFTSLPEVLRGAGYDCGLVGKWHLGDNIQPQEGLDDYWITMPHGGTSTFYDASIIEDGKIRREPEYLTDFWTQHALKFIEQKSKSDKPFFLFLSYNGPYSLSRLLLREGKNRHAEYYRGKPLSSFPREPTHPWQYSNRDYQNNPVSIERVATEVSGVDDGVGRVMGALKQHGIDDNTLVVFVADQGWSGGHGGFFGMGDHTRPVTARDEMMRIPMIWRHPPSIAANRRSNRIVTNYDFLPTVLSQLGLKNQPPKNEPVSPGIDFSSDLSNAKPLPKTTEDRAVYYEFENLRCIRTSRWKYVHRYPNGPHELFDLDSDPSEFNNLVGDAGSQSTRDRLRTQLRRFYDKHAAPEFDLWKEGGSQTRTFIGIEEELAQRDPVEPPAPPADFRPQSLQVPEGFSVELAAAPPLVTHPTMACFDDRGRLFVCNNAGVNLSAEALEKSRPNSIRMLEDLDGDGRYDRSTVYADKMTFPMGATWLGNSLYVASPPNIWRLEDTNGDGKADKREKLVSQFGYTGNAASIHGCFFGPDGRMYWCDGYHGHEFKEGDKITSQREGSYMFSCWPDGTDVRIHCGGGMDNPVELDFTPQGDVIGTVNILYSRPRVDCQVHWQYGGAYPHRERVLDELKVTGPLLEPMHRFGHVAISGTMRYRSGAIDHRWRDNFFSTFFNSGKVVRLEMTPRGSTFQVTQREFLSCESRDFHPTDVLEDADGSLLVVDTGGWFYRGCPTSQLAKPEIPGAIYRIKRKGMTTLIDPRGERIVWAKLSLAQLAARLNDSRHHVRERAVVECAKRGDPMVATLKTALQRRDIRNRIGAVRVLTRLAREKHEGHAAARTAIRIALSDRSERVVQAACHAIAQNPDPLALNKLHLLLTSSDHGFVRRTAAVAIGRIGESSSAKVLLAAAGKAVDREEEHAITFALIEIDAAEPARKALAESSPAVRKAALVSLDQMDSFAMVSEVVAPLLDGDDADLRQAAWRVFQRHAKRSLAAKQDVTQWTTSASQRIEFLVQHPAEAEKRTDVLQGMVAMFASSPNVATIVGDALSDAKTSIETRRTLLEALANGRGLTLHKALAEPLKEALVSNDAKELDVAIKAAGAFRSNQFKPDLQRIGANRKLPAMTRVAALRAANGQSSALNGETFDVLLELLGSDQSPANASRASQLLGASTLTAKQLVALAPKLETAGPLALRDLVRPFQRNGAIDVGNAFLEAMKAAKSLSSVPTPEVSDVVKRYPPELRDRANALLNTIEQHQQSRVAKLDTFVEHLKQGQPARGQALFFHEKSKCSSCHKVKGKGEAVGPDLSTIGANRSSRDLLESIVFPSASIVRQYEPYSVIMSDGRVLSGLITRESGSSITLQQQVGEAIEIARNEIDEISPSTVSLMPVGVDEALTKQELADLVAWMRELK